MARSNPKVAYLEEALSFIESIPKSAGDKLLEIVHRVELGERNSIIFSKLEGTEIWEFRTLYNKVKYRLFAFWDTQTDTLVIATHGIIKKTQKTPKKEIAKAESSEEVLDKHFGKVGTPRRDEFERSVASSVHAYELGEAIKKARLEQNLTQEQLGQRIGVQRAQISRLEKGYSISIPTISRVFQALGVTTATLDLGGTIGKIALW